MNFRLEPEHDVKIFKTFFQNKLNFLQKIKNLVVTEFDISDFIATMYIRRFFKNFKLNLNKLSKENAVRNLKGFGIMIPLKMPDILSLRRKRLGEFKKPDSIIFEDAEQSEEAQGEMKQN